MIEQHATLMPNSSRKINKSDVQMNWLVQGDVPEAVLVEMARYDGGYFNITYEEHFRRCGNDYYTNVRFSTFRSRNLSQKPNFHCQTKRWRSFGFNPVTLP